MNKLSSPRLMLITTMLGFLLVTFFLWADELFDLPALVLGANKTPVNIAESLFESLIVLMIAALTGIFILFLEKKITKLNEEKAKILSIISHDLNNAFVGLLGNTNLLHAKATQFEPDKIGEISLDINHSAKQVSVLLANLLQWSKLNTGIIQAHPENAGLLPLISQNIKLLHTPAALKKITITHHIENSIYVRADKPMLNSIIQNLLNNAIKFTPSQGRIQIESVTDQNTIHLYISDTGIGMSENEIKNIFSLKLGNTRRGTAGEKGTGLGLSICKQFIEANHGSLSIQSQPGRGTKIRIALPSGSAV
ncbi:HAMP domain-containing histidine kinase [bacterium]|nr:HAMP domain-containing histidine kinase [bacterium]